MRLCGKGEVVVFLQSFLYLKFCVGWKLMVLKEDLKKWKKEVFGYVGNKSKQLLEQLQILEDREIVGNFSGVDLESKMGPVAELEEISLMEEISWR